MIIIIFETRAVSSVLAHDPAHCVPGITLPPGDATFSLLLGLAQAVKKSLDRATLRVLLWYCCGGEVLVKP